MIQTVNVTKRITHTDYHLPSMTKVDIINISSVADDISIFQDVYFMPQNMTYQKHNTNIQT